MKNSEVIQFTTKELVERIEEEKNHLVRLKLNHVVSPLDNPQTIRSSRRNIARMLTEYQSRKLSGKL